MSGVQNTMDDTRMEKNWRVVITVAKASAP